MPGFASTSRRKAAEVQGQQCLLRNVGKLPVGKLQTLCFLILWCYSAAQWAMGDFINQ